MLRSGFEKPFFLSNLLYTPAFHSGRLDDSSGNGAVFFQKSAILNLSSCNETHSKKNKNKKEVFDMNTKTMEQFEVMDVEMLASVEGGYSAGKCLADIGW